ncbi:DUF1800 domain-containing protein [Vibrio maerlii]|uniref:DUF1800 domain-containing protein n=1 Tax=Vibrio maerlii TaxID=2231648 RepID=UPI000E3E228F|nr:DUF1800 domain-containing protein [Vibrio maerlii]
MPYYPTQEILRDQRFGLGARLGSPTSMPLEEQLKAASYLHSSIQSLPSTDGLLLKVGEFRQARAKLKGDKEGLAKLRDEQKAFARNAYRQQSHARMLQSIHTPLGFQERLIQFWSNHFAISVDTRRVFALSTTIENDVCRQYWDQSFSQMLLATCQHPAMLMYLDNVSSIGPDTVVGKRRSKGLNENLAREILELHSLGVTGGYDQQDVQELAKGITGWSVRMKPNQVGYFYHDKSHQPGSITVLGKRYNQAGEQQGRAILEELARHPSTARHLAGKLCQHFIGDTAKVLVDEMAQAYLKSDTQLLPMYQILISSSEAQNADACRFRTPNEWLVALLRSVDVEINESQSFKLLTRLGQPPFLSRSPAGWSDDDSDYNSPSALVQRIQIAGQLAAMVIKQAKQKEQPTKQLADAIVKHLYGEHLDEHTQLVLSQTDKASMQLSLVWLSPQFQYR